jgi:hypothetical protein
MDANRWARVGLLTLVIEYLKEKQEYDRLVAQRELIDKQRQARWAEIDASWDKFHAEMQDLIERTKAIEIK